MLCCAKESNLIEIKALKLQSDVVGALINDTQWHFQCGNVLLGGARKLRSRPFTPIAILRMRCDLYTKAVKA